MRIISAISQEIGHLKLVVFAGEWLFEEFLRANGAYRGFFLKKPFTINTVGFKKPRSRKSHQFGVLSFPQVLMPKQKRPEPQMHD